MEEVDSRFLHLLQPIRDLTRNWEVDVAAQLAEYLGELDQVSISFDQGRTSMNFLEAAMLIQGSACVYSKKVEHLYLLVHQALDSIFSKKKDLYLPHCLALPSLDSHSLRRGRHREFLSLDDLTDCSQTSRAGRRNRQQACQLPVPARAVGTLRLTPMAVVPLDEAEKKKDPLLSGSGDVLGSRWDFQMNSCSPEANGAFLLGTATSYLGTASSYLGTAHLEQHLEQHLGTATSYLCQEQHPEQHLGTATSCLGTAHLEQHLEQHLGTAHLEQHPEQHLGTATSCLGTAHLEQHPEQHLGTATSYLCQEQHPEQHLGTATSCLGTAHLEQHLEQHLGTAHLEQHPEQHLGTATSYLCQEQHPEQHLGTATSCLGTAHLEQHLEQHLGTATSCLGTAHLEQHLEQHLGTATSCLGTAHLEQHLEQHLGTATSCLGTAHLEQHPEQHLGTATSYLCQEQHLEQHLGTGAEEDEEDAAEALGGGMEVTSVPSEHLEPLRIAPQGRGYILRDRDPPGGHPKAPSEDEPDPWHSLDPFGDSEEKPFRKGSPFLVPQGLDSMPGGKRKRKVLRKLQDFLGWFSSAYNSSQEGRRRRRRGPSFVDLEVLYWQHFKHSLGGHRKVQRREELPWEQLEQEQEDGAADDDFVEPEALQELGEASQEPPEPTYEELVRGHVEQFLAGSRRFLLESELSRHVRLWEERVRPLLQEQESRAPFDVHAYGQLLAEGCAQPPGWHSLASLVAGQPPFEVCRYLLASLQLANDGVVELAQDAGLELALDTARLRPLSGPSAQHRIQSFQLPSHRDPCPK